MTESKEELNSLLMRVKEESGKVGLKHKIQKTKIIALTIWTFVGKVMPLLFNTLSRLVIAFLPGSKRLLVSWLQSPPAVTSEPKKIKSVTVSIVSPISLQGEISIISDMQMTPP